MSLCFSACCSRWNRWDGAHHAIAEAGRSVAERQVEAAAHVLRCDVVRQPPQAGVVEKLAETPLIRAMWAALPVGGLSALFGLVCAADRAGLGGCPWMEPGNPGAHGAPVGLVFGPEFAGQGGFFIEAHRGCADAPGYRGVFEEAQRAEQQRLAGQDGQEAGVDRVAHIPVAPAYH